ncbi:MAG TPA: hypothetical protein VFY25_16500 [Anaerolineales bacterium]|nr:hypothetical protein [Anaerolineales bacterium]
MFPDSREAAVDEDYGHYPALRTIDTGSVLGCHEVRPLLMSQERRIKIRQKADQGAFEVGLHQIIEILAKDRLLPARNIDRYEMCPLVRSNLTSIPQI